MTDTLTLTGLHVHRAPGFQQGGFEIDDLGPGVNLIHGPNASGKTTFAKAIQGILWPGKSPENAHLIGRFTLSDEGWRVHVEARHATYQRNGQDTERPGLPPADQRDRYVIALHDLLQDETQDAPFAERIVREMQGGYDISQAASDLGYDSSTATRGKRVVKDAEDALSAYRAALQDTQALLDEERRLPQLRRKLAKIKEAQRRSTVLEKALEHANARKTYEAKRKKMRTFPDGMERIEGDEFETVNRHDERLEKWKGRKKDAQGKRQAAKEDLEQANLPETPSEGFLEKLKKLRDDIEKKESKLDDAEANLKAAKRSRTNAINDIPADVRAEDLENLDPVAWNSLQGFVKKAERVQAKKATKQALERRLDEQGTPDEDPTTLRKGRDLLGHWLAAPAANAEAHPRTRRSILLLGTLTVTLALVAGALAWPTMGPLAAALIALSSLAIAAGLIAYGRGPVEPVAEPTAYRSRFQDLDLRPPEEWQRDAVRSRHDELQAQLAAHDVHEAQTRLLETLREQDADLEQEEQALEEERQALLEQHGLAANMSHLDLYATANGISRWQQAHDDVVKLEETIQALGTQHEALTARLNEALEPFGYETLTDSTQARETIRELENRAFMQKDAERALRQAQGTIKEAAEQIQEIETERAAVFASAGLEAGDHDRLRELCKIAPEHQTAKRDMENAKLLVENAREALEDAEQGSKLVEASIHAIEEEQRDVQEATAQYEETLEAINRIEAKVDEAKRQRTVEEALTEKQRCLDALEEELQADYASKVGHVLTEHLQKETSGANQPAVFEEASDILSRITKERYELDVDPDEATFRAYDTVKERGFDLDSLSSGTRVQVLLAVRIAFVEHFEKGTRLPLVLDEALANTDDGRADAIIESVLELARDGRQIFYFTAQGDEVAKWVSRLEEAPGIEHTLHDLAPVQGLQGHVHVPDLSEVHVQTPSPPDPSGHSPGSYADEIDVEPFNPRQGAGRAHIWYMVEDLDVLHRLLEIGVERWGPLKRMLERGSEHLVTDDASLVASIERRGHALEAFVDAWRRGRGRLVTRAVLEESGAVSETFIEEVAALARRADGDGERIVAELRGGGVDRFRTGKMDELEAYFVENGYIDAVDPLSPKEVRMRMLQKVSVMDDASEAIVREVDAVLERIQSRGAVAREVASS